MRRRVASLACVVAVTAAAACSQASTPAGAADAGDIEASTDAGIGGDAGSDEPPTFTRDEWAALQALSPPTLPAALPDVSNAKADDAAAAALGQTLFYTGVFSGPLLDGENDGRSGSLGAQGEAGKVACASCHVGTTDFADTRSPSRQISFASSWGRRRAPSLLDVGQTRIIMWGGRHDALYNQVFGPIESPVEMNSSRLYAAQQVFLQFRAAYEQVFGAMPPLDDTSRFPAVTSSQTGCHPIGAIPGESNTLACDGTWVGYPGDKGPFDSMSPADQDAVTRVVVNVGKAIGAFERLLTCGQGRFDQFMQGTKTALSPSEQRGAQLFVGAGQCVKCHSGPFLSDQSFHAMGLAAGSVAGGFIDVADEGASADLAACLADPLNTKGAFSDGDDGRLPASVPTSATGAFRTPILRCVSRRPSFFHTGQATSLDAVVAFFNGGGEGPPVPGMNELAPLGLTAGQQSDLVAFLRALDGPGADPKYQHAP